MGFHENAKFPAVAEYTSSGGPGGASSVTRLRSGAEERNTPWSGLPHTFDIALDFKERDQVAEIVRFYHQRNGLENGFRFEDPSDHTSSSVGYDADEGLGGIDITDEDVEIGVGNASTTEFQLIKIYTDGVSPQRTRTINKPIDGSVVIALDGVAQTEGVHFTVTTTTGVIVFMTAPDAGVSVTAGFKFDVPVRFSENVNSAFHSEIKSWDSAGIQTCSLIELLEPPYADDEWWPGGSITFEFGANTHISPLDGKLVVAAATTTGLKLILPDVATLPSNGEYFKVIAEAGSSAFEVRDITGTVIVANMSAGDALHFAIYVNASAIRVWRAF